MVHAAVVGGVTGKKQECVAHFYLDIYLDLNNQNVLIHANSVEETEFLTRLGELVSLGEKFSDFVCARDCAWFFPSPQISFDQAISPY